MIAGIGSIAAAGAAVTGMGAFQSVEADRQVTISVTGDATAYLGLSSDNEFINNDNGGTSTLTLDLGSAGASNTGGSGLNNESVTTFRAVNVANNGEDDATLTSVETDDLSSDVSASLVSAVEISPGNMANDVIEFTVDTRGSVSTNAGSVTLVAEDSDGAQS